MWSLPAKPILPAKPASGDEAPSWRAFWGRANRLYVNQRHLEFHCRKIADDMLSVLPATADGWRVLDYGCGEALDAARLAARVDTLLLYDASGYVREHLRARFADMPRIRVLDDADLSQVVTASVDAIFVVSVVQYLTEAEIGTLLGRCRRWLRPGGILIVADVIPPVAGMIDDVVSLLRTAIRGGFLLAALGGLAATLFSDYRRLRRQLGLTVLDAAAAQRLLDQAGFDAERQEHNFGFNRRRMTFIARRR